MKRRKLLAMALSSAPMGIALPAFAQPIWPSRPITLVVPFPPGGVADKVARPVAESLQNTLKQPVVVENRSGAGGGVGMAHVAKAKPDGYTLLMALSSVSIIPEADRIMSRRPLYTLDQLEPIARFTAETVVVAVNANSPWKSIHEFVNDGRRRELTYGSSGTYGTLHIFMEALRSEAKMKIVHIPYTGAAPSITALLGGQVDALATSPASVLEHVKAGKLRVLAHYGDKPVPAFPGVPSLKESGYAVEFAQWAGLFAPAGTPSVILDKLRDAARAASTDSKVKTLIDAAGAELSYADGDEFRKYWATDAELLIKALQKIGRID